MVEKGTYWLTRIVFLRCLAAVYLPLAAVFCLLLPEVAFLVALHQNKQLIGRNGLLPADLYLEDIEERVGGKKASIFAKLTPAPTLLWFADMDKLDFYLDLIAYAGLAVSLVVMITGAANMLAMTLLWILYHSLVAVGQRWYSFGWESQLLETGFLAVFFCPLMTWKQFPKHTPPPWVAIYGLRWLIFRIMLGAGLIKIRGDQCWRDLTCMDYHYETQPVPNPNAYFMHQSPPVMHKLETAGNHVVELGAPFLLLIPFRPAVMLGGILQLLFMGVIIISGNLSFLNHLTMLPSLCCFDDRFYSMFFPSSTIEKLEELQKDEERGSSKLKVLGHYIRQVLNITLTILIAYLSIPVVQNLMSRRQMMNTSFDPLRIVNTYGAFGSITKERTEVIMQGTSAKSPHDPNAEWLEYEFKCKPGNITRRPCQISPYHYRLDWLMWFSAFQNYQHNPWLVHLVARMLENDEFIGDLIDTNPFQGKEPPSYIRLEHYRYSFSKVGSKESKSGKWWKRRRIGEYLPPVNYDMLKGIMKQFRWDRKRK